MTVGVTMQAAKTLVSWHKVLRESVYDYGTGIRLTGRH